MLIIGDSLLTRVGGEKKKEGGDNRSIYCRPLFHLELQLFIAMIPHMTAKTNHGIEGKAMGPATMPMTSWARLTIAPPNVLGRLHQSVRSFVHHSMKKGAIRLPSADSCISGLRKEQSQHQHDSDVKGEGGSKIWLTFSWRS